MPRDLPSFPTRRSSDLEDRLAGEVVLVRPAAARGARLALAGLRLDALVAPRERLLVCRVRRARFLVRLVKLGGAILSSDAGRGEEHESEQPAFHGALSGRIF